MFITPFSPGAVANAVKRGRGKETLRQGTSLRGSDASLRRRGLSKLKNAADRGRVAVAATRIDDRVLDLAGVPCRIISTYANDNLSL